MPIVQCIPLGALQVNCYLVENEATQQLIIIDPGVEPEAILRQVGSRTPVAVLLTHGHHDHVGAVDAVCSHYGISPYIHRADVPLLRDPVRNVSHAMGQDMVVKTKPIPVEDGQLLSLAGINLTLWHTPGHTPGGACFLLPEGQGVFTGDVLFDGGYGRTDFPGGDFSQLKQSLRRLFALCPRQVAYPGHGASTWVGQDTPKEGAKPQEDAL